MAVQRLLACFALLSSTPVLAQQSQSIEIETGSTFGPYAGPVSAPFNGVAVYANGDGVVVMLQSGLASGRFQLDITGASSNASNASIAVYLGSAKVGDATFSGTVPSVDNVVFDLSESQSTAVLRFILETDTGANDTLLDSVAWQRVGDVPAPPGPPPLPVTGSYESGEYRNMFAELGYSAPEIEAKLNAAYQQLFLSANADQNAGETILIDAGNNSAYIWDTGNDDVRSEGLSYGMMIAVQMDRQTDFNKIWKWAHENTLNRSGDFKGYFAWRTRTDGTPLDRGPAPDGEEYFVTALFFAAHRWGDGQGIYNYTAQANQILDDMFVFLRQSIRA